MVRKRVSIKDVAEIAGVSYQTVSKVLNGQAHVSSEKAARILASARELGYKPNRQARNLRVQRSHLIGYSWLPTRPDQVNHILDRLLTSMVEEANAAGYYLLPFPYREGEMQVESYQELIEAGQVDGFVLSSVNYNDQRLGYLLEQRFPFVAFGRSHSGQSYHWVDVDGEAGLRLATEHLLERGHRRIAALAWPEESRVGNDRLQGYFGALRAVGLTPESGWLARGEGNFEFGYTATQRWLALPAEQRPTALVAMSDTMAIGAIHAGQTQGLTIGRDLAVVGFDDAPMAQYLWPPLTTIRQPMREVGRKCVEILLKAITGRAPEPETVLLRPELVVRASS